jgi:hypothetical protein
MWASRRTKQHTVDYGATCAETLAGKGDVMEQVEHHDLVSDGQQKQHSNLEQQSR